MNATFVPVDTSTIPGWGVDADPENDPTYPMRDMSRDHRALAGVDWARPAQQPQDVEILRSIEYNQLPAVFGTSAPPRGISGTIRRIAFRRSESDWWHWLLLMGADRINVVEGVVGDLARLKVPNIPAEMGIKSEIRHNRSGLGRKIGILAVLGGAGMALALRARSRRVADAPEPDPRADDQANEDADA